MSLLEIVIILIIVGVVLWLIDRFIPMHSTIKKILNAIVIIVVIIWLLSVFGIIEGIDIPRIGL